MTGPAPQPVAAAEITTRAPRLADLPAAPVFALAELCPATGWPWLTATPSPDGGVSVRAFSAPLVAELHLADADAARPVSVMASDITAIRRRHRDAARLVLDQGPQGLALRSFSEGATVTLAAVEPAEHLPDLPPLADRQPKGQPPSQMVEPSQILRVMAVAQRLCLSAVLRSDPEGPDSPVGLAVTLNGEGVRGLVRIARCLPMKLPP
jgi:hypothetical protein